MGSFLNEKNWFDLQKGIFMEDENNMEIWEESIGRNRHSGRSLGGEIVAVIPQVPKSHIHECPFLCK